MPIDTETKRRSMLGMGLMFLVIAPVPDGTLSSVDRLHIIGFPGTITPAAPGVLTSNIHIFASTTTEPNHAADSGDNLLINDTLEVQQDAYLGGASNYLKVIDGVVYLIGDTNIVFQKASGKGIKVDTTTPTFGWRDLLGETTTRSTGANKPSFEAYNGEINQYRFAAGKHEHYDFHIPHDYVIGTDIHLHIHWSQISTTNTGGTVNFKYSAVYAKGHNQAAFTGTPITDTFTSADAGTTRYQQHITETIISGASATSALFDRDDLEPDGLILLTLEMDANNLTDGVSVTDPFIHYVDVHYQSTNISTKDKVPDFYA